MQNQMQCGYQPQNRGLGMFEGQDGAPSMMAQLQRFSPEMARMLQERSQQSPRAQMQAQQGIQSQYMPPGMQQQQNQMMSPYAMFGGGMFG